MAAVKKRRTEPRGSRAITDETPAELAGLPSRAKDLRIERGWTQDQLAEKAGVSQPTISNLEKSRSLKGVRLISAFRVARIFDMTLDEFALGLANPWNTLAAAVARGVNPLDVEPKEPGSVPAPALEPGAAPKPKRKSPPRRR